MPDLAAEGPDLLALPREGVTHRQEGLPHPRGHSFPLPRRRIQTAVGPVASEPGVGSHQNHLADDPGDSELFLWGCVF